MKILTIVLNSILLSLLLSSCAFAASEAMEYPSGLPMEVYSPGNPPPTASINWDDPATLAVQPWYKDTNDTYLTNLAHEVGIGTNAPTSKLSITSGGTNANAMSNTGYDLFVKGNIELDGKIYGDGSQLTGIAVTPDGTFNPTNILQNGDFEAWSNGVSSIAPDGWTNIVLSSSSRNATHQTGTYSANLTRSGGNDMGLGQELYRGNYLYYTGKTLSFSCWVKASSANTARIALADGSNLTYSAYHTGDNTWQLLKVQMTVSGGQTVGYARLYVLNNDTNALFDGAIVVEGNGYYAFAQRPYEIQTNGSNAYFPNGNIGIGTTTVPALLTVGVNPTIPTGSIPAVAVHGNIVTDGNIYGNGSNLTGLPASMVYPGAGIALSTGSAWSTSITDASSNWNTAYTDRLKWDGGSTGLTAATGRTSLALSSTDSVTFGTATVGTGNLLVSSGNVGIGTTVNVGKLDVAAGVTTNTYAMNLTGSINDFYQINMQNVSVGTSAQSGIAFTRNDGTNTDKFAWVGVNNSAFNNPQTYNVGNAKDMEILVLDGNIYQAAGTTGKLITFLTGGVAEANRRMTIDPSGNVGIGSTAPTQKLDVTGTVKATLFSGSGASLTNVPAEISGLNTGYISKAGSATTIVDSAIYQNGTNIGIGTTVPTQALSVAGAITAVGTGNTYVGGNLGIGSTTPEQALVINGRLRNISIGTTTAGTLVCYKADGTQGWCSGSLTGSICATCN